MPAKPTVVSPSKSLELWIGPDRYRKRERVHQLLAERQVPVLDRHQLPASGATAAVLLTLAREAPAAGGLRLVIVEDAHKLDAATVKALAEQSGKLPPTTLVILLADDGGSDGPASLKALAEVARVERFPWMTPAEVRQWMDGRLSQAGKRIHAAAARDVLSAYGADLAGLGGWLDQALAWLGDRDEITADDLRELLGVRRSPATVQEAAGKGGFAMMDALGRRDAASALRAMQEQCDAGKDELELLGLVVWRLQRWVQVAHLSKTKVPPDRIATATGLQGWQLERMQRELAGWSIASLRRVLDRCLELDLAIKTGRIAPRLGLETLIVAVCSSKG